MVPAGRRTARGFSEAEAKSADETRVVAWRAAYAAGLVVYGYPAVGFDRAVWAGMPDAGLIRVDLAERLEYAPGWHYRRGAEAEWYAMLPDGEIVWGDDPAERTRLEKAGALVKTGQQVSDARMEAARAAATAWPGTVGG